MVRRLEFDRRMKVPIGLRGWFDVVDFVAFVPFLAMGVQVYQDNGEEQSGWWSLPTQ